MEDYKSWGTPNLFISIPSWIYSYLFHPGYIYNIYTHTHIYTLFCLFGDYYTDTLLESQYPHGPIMVGPAPKKTKVQVASLDAQQFRPLTELWRVERFPTMKLVAGGF